MGLRLTYTLLMTDIGVSLRDGKQANSGSQQSSSQLVVDSDKQQAARSEAAMLESNAQPAGYDVGRHAARE